MNNILVFFICAATLAVPSYHASATVGGEGCPGLTLDGLVDEMEAGNTHLIVHTDSDGDRGTSTGPGDLYSPGEIRGNIYASDAAGVFAASISKEDLVLEGFDQTLWEGVNATGTAAFTVHRDESGTITHVSFAITLRDLYNLTGLHVHHGDPTVNDSFLYAEILPTVNSIPIDPVEPIMGVIKAGDLCPATLMQHGTFPACNLLFSRHALDFGSMNEDGVSPSIHQTITNVGRTVHHVAMEADPWRDHATEFAGISTEIKVDGILEEWTPLEGPVQVAGMMERGESIEIEYRLDSSGAGDIPSGLELTQSFAYHITCEE